MIPGTPYAFLAALEPANPWPGWLLVLLGLMALAAVGYLYAVERRQVTRPIGVVLLTLRVLAILVVLFMLFEPVDVRQERSVLQPIVAVLVDRSASMDTTLAYLSDGEKLQLADALGELPENKRPVRLDMKLTRLAGALQNVDDAWGWLADESRPLPKAKIDVKSVEQAATAAEELLKAMRQVTGGTEGWQAKLPDAARREAVDKSARVDSQLVNGLKKFAQQAGAVGNPAVLKAPERKKLAELLESVQKGTKDLSGDILRLSQQVDAALADGLDAPNRAILARVGQMTRRQFAQRLAAGPAGGWRSKLDQPTDPALKPLVRTYEFAGQTADLNSAAPASQPGRDSADSMTTNVAGAIQQALSDVGQAPLATVVLFSDGRHNKAGVNPETAASAVVGKSAVLHTVLVGGRSSPPDAAVVEISAPPSVFLKDELEVQSTIKLDGLVGRDVHVRLEQDGKTLADETLRPGAVEDRLPVKFTVQPERAGRQRYDVVVEPQAMEVNRTNNRSSVLVDVVKDHSTVLLVDREPRWEYRYLRNLLLRDKQIKLQAVLTHPFAAGNAIKGTPLSAKAGADSSEVDRPPEKPEDWLNFDVIILGDLTPNELPEAVQRALVQFVSERGGTLVMIAGQSAMPEAFKSQPLETILPVTAEGANVGMKNTPGLAYRLALTADGESSTVLQLSSEAAANLRIWAGLARHYWLSPYHMARAGTNVLAYADSAVEPSPASQPAAGHDPQVQLEKERQNAAISWRNVGLGRVMFLGLDSTWRFRQRIGDSLHHRFWSQLIRWATAERMTSGWKHVKFGCDQPIYAEGEPLVVKARLTGLDFSPLSDAELRVNVLSGATAIAGARLIPSPNVPGLYEARISGLKPGGYVLSLEGPQLASLRDPSNPNETVEALKGSVEVRAGLATELAELTPDAAAMAQWAGVGHGLPLTPGSVAALQAAIQPKPIYVEFATRTPLWNTWTMLLIFAALVTLEWIIRKRCGLA